MSQTFQPMSQSSLTHVFLPGENAIIDEECNEALNNKELFWLIPSKNRSNLVDTRGKSFKWISEKKKSDFFTWLQLKNLVNMILSLEMFFYYSKSVAYIQDGLLFRKFSFWMCLKTRRVTKRDALVLATLRYS